MNARVFFLAGMLALTALAFSGSLAETTGVEIAPSAAAECIVIDDSGDCLPSPTCIVAGALTGATGEEFSCTL